MTVLDRKALMKSWPKDRGDVAGARALLAHGYPALTPVLKDIVHWTQSGGPVVSLFCKFLAELGEPAVELVRPALKGTHDQQILNLLREVMPAWPRSALLAVSSELHMLLTRGSVFGVNVFALALLVRARAEIEGPAEEWVRLFRDRLNVQLSLLDKIDEQFALNADHKL